MRELDLYEVLRYALAGVVGLLGLFAICPDARLLFGSDISLAEGTFVGGIALTWGAMVYAVHRGIVYPVLQRVVLIPYLWKAGLRWRLLVLYWSVQEEMQRDRQRWKAVDSGRTPFREWGDQVHFLYCSAWALLSARALTLVWCCEYETTSIATLCVWMAAFVAITAFFHDARLTRAENAWLESNNRVNG
jgi:hypothetical protein